MMRIIGTGILVAVVFGITNEGVAEPADPDNVPERPRIYSPYVERTVRNASLAEGVYWGDTHLHTNYSTDSGMLGNTLGPETEPVGSGSLAFSELDQLIGWVK